jgi:hypothetical protein
MDHEAVMNEHLVQSELFVGVPKTNHWLFSRVIQVGHDVKLG